MAGLLSGLASLGLGNLEKAKVFEEPVKDEKKDAQGTGVPEIQEKDLVYDRSQKCPVCDNDFSSKVMKSGKVKLEGTDPDLRPKYDGVDPLKYDVIVCPKCGYAALTRYFKTILSSQSKMIREKISQNIQIKPNTGDIYTYEEAMERYKLALACAIVKQAKASEKAYICLKSAWVMRGQAEHLDEATENYQSIKAALEKEELEYLQTALEGFISARQTEETPMCGMDEITVDYLISVLAVRFEQYDVASKLISNIITSPLANARMKDKARDLKDTVVARLKQER